MTDEQSLAVGLMITPLDPLPRAAPFMIGVNENGSARIPNASVRWRRLGEDAQAGTTTRIVGMNGPRRPDGGGIRAFAHPVPVESPFGQAVLQGAELIGSLGGAEIGTATVVWARRTGGGLPEGGLQVCISWCHGGPEPEFGGDL